MIKIVDINKSFGDTHVTKGVSIDFEPGKMNYIIGQSGSGKSVLTKCIVGLMPVDSGKVYYDGREFTELSNKKKKSIRKEIGMLFQGGALFDSMTVKENVIFPLYMFSDMTRSEMEKRAEICLERVQLKNKDSLYPSEISGGMKKRVALARAISMSPKYLFCDEPNSGLDPQTAIVIDKLIQEITYEFGITTVVISHDMNSVMETGDKINYLFEGQVWWKGDRNQILLSDNNELNNFVYASKFMKQVRENLR